MVFPSFAVALPDLAPVAMEDFAGQVVASFVSVELNEDTPTVGLVIDVGEQEETFGYRPTSAMALASSDCFEPVWRARTRS